MLRSAILLCLATEACAISRVAPQQHSSDVAGLWRRLWGDLGWGGLQEPLQCSKIRDQTSELAIACWAEYGPPQPQHMTTRPAAVVDIVVKSFSPDALPTTPMDGKPECEVYMYSDGPFGGQENLLDNWQARHLRYAHR